MGDGGNQAILAQGFLNVNIIFYFYVYFLDFANTCWGYFYVEVISSSSIAL